MNNAFLKSFITLTEVYQQQAFSTIALNKTLNNCKSQDKALITKLVYGVLDNDIKLQYIVSKYVKKMPKGDVLLLLKMGAYCLMELSIPVYTVVNDLAELAKVTEDKRQVGFVNATLKNISKTVKTFDDYPSDELQALSTQYSYPLWALNKLVKDYGKDVAKQIITYTPDNRTTVRFSKPTPVDKAQQLLGEVHATPFDDAFYFVGKLPQMDDAFTVQSLSSMAVARVCANAVTQGKFIDCCSAPGGKAVYYKQLCPNVQVTACDIHPHRQQLIDSYAKRMGVNISTHCADMTVPVDDWQNSFDGVLCDVPCSGFGVLNNRPDIKLFRQNKDISDLMKLQYAILSNCANYVKVGGVLVYSTCTVFDNENGQNVRKFLKEHPNFCLDKLNLPQIPQADGQPYYQFLPHKDGMQGFYVAILRRTE